LACDASILRLEACERAKLRGRFMSDSRRELSPADLAAFDLLIAMVQEEGLSSVNLRDLLFTRGLTGEGRVRDRVGRVVRYGNYVYGQLRAFPPPDQPDAENVTLGDLDVELTLEELLEMRKNLFRHLPGNDQTSAT
jgi:hypothetical protein